MLQAVEPGAWTQNWYRGSGQMPALAVIVTAVPRMAGEAGADEAPIIVPAETVHPPNRDRSAAHSSGAPPPYCSAKMPTPPSAIRFTRSYFSESETGSSQYISRV